MIEFAISLVISVLAAAVIYRLGYIDGRRDRRGSRAAQERAREYKADVSWRHGHD